MLTPCFHRDGMLLAWLGKRLERPDLDLFLELCVGVEEQVRHTIVMAFRHYGVLRHFIEFCLAPPWEHEQIIRSNGTSKESMVTRRIRMGEKQKLQGIGWTDDC